MILNICRMWLVAKQKRNTNTSEYLDKGTLFLDFVYFHLLLAIITF